MGLTNLQRQWIHAASRLGLRIQVPYEHRFSDGSWVEFEVRLLDFGAKNGMLILSDSRVLQYRKDEISAAGFGYSCYGPIQDGETTSLEGFTEMLDDWGFLGRGENAPKMLPNPPSPNIPREVKAGFEVREIVPNHSSASTLAAGTSPAEQEPRLP